MDERGKSKEDIKRLRADRKKLLDSFQTLLNGAHTFLEPGNKMENSSEAMVRLRKVILESQAILNDMKSSR